MNWTVRNTAMRSLGLAGILTLFAGLVAAFGQSASPKQPYSTWSDFGGSIDSMQYSSLKQINKTNVRKLELAWFHPVMGKGNFPCSPLIVELYFHPGHDDAPWWQRTHFDDTDKSAYFEQWRAIVGSIGRQYGKKLAGWWFDDAAFTYYPFNPDWEQMTEAARAGNPDRVVAYNSWILPKLNDFYDVYTGENGSWETKYEDLAFLPAGGTGRYTGGPQDGLQAETTVIVNGSWGHFKSDQPIGPPRFSVDDFASRLKDAISRKSVPLLDLEVYQDGTISPQTLQFFQAVRKAIGLASTEP